MFPHFINSKNSGNQHVVLWQLDHYHYEVEFTGGDVIDLYETAFEDAVAYFNKVQVRH